MKTRKISLFVAAALFTSTVFISSCHKPKTEEDSDTSEAADHSVAENTSNDIVSIGSQASDNSSGSLSSYKMGNNNDILSSCATVKRDTVNHVDSVIFNNSTCLDGRVRNGILIYNYSASTNGAKHYRDPGFNCSVSASNYNVDGNNVNIINKTIVNTTPLGFNPATTNLTWNINGHIQVVTSSGTHDFSFSRTKTLLNTSNPSVYHGSAIAISWNLAKISLTGNASGTTAKGKTYTAAITYPVIRDFGGCNIGGKHPFIQGRVEFTPEGKATRYIDFGDGTCDLIATVTIKNKTFTITLK
jgi:hypothetical protein